MIVSLWLKNFRRYVDEKFEFKPGVNFIKGKNNVGKSTVFYAIEYVLFGRVGHFKSPIALLQPNTKSLGVEVVFCARDGNFYRLQRIHVLPPKARTKVIGHYTLKQLSGNPATEKEVSETYVLSSDFQDHEESLALKLSELLGLSHKLFDVAINLRQGEITTVLEGAPKLDIVLGVTSAVLAGEQMRSMALEFEKASATYDLHNEQLKRLETEKTVQQDQQQQLERESGQLDDRAKGLTMLSTLSEQIGPARQQLQAEYQMLSGHLQSLTEMKGQAAQIASRQAQITEQEGAIEDLQGNLVTLSDAIGTQQTIKQEWQAKTEQFSQTRSELDKLLGDLSGRIHRRELLPTGEGAECETCGQAIDSELHQKEIAQWRKESEEIQNQCIVIEKDRLAAQTKINELDEIIQSSHLTHKLKKRAIAEIEQLVQEAQNQSSDIKQQESLLLACCKACLQAVDDYAEVVGSLEIDEELVDLLTLSINAVEAEQCIEQQQWQAVLDLLTPALDKLEEALKVRIIQAKTELMGIDDNQQRIAQSLKQLATRNQQIENELAGACQQLASLQEKQNAAQTLRQLLSGFKELQTLLRDKVSQRLAKDTFALHKALSKPDTEFKSLSIDPNRYVINVVPKDLGKEVPAYLYQGGGHKLLLGVAFKLAIAKTVGPCSFMLLDEPTYGLDSTHRQALLQRIAELNITQQMFLITHDVDDIEGHHIHIKSEGKSSTQERV